MPILDERSTTTFSINGQGSVMSLMVSIGALGINGQGLMHSSRLRVLMVQGRTSSSIEKC